MVVRVENSEDNLRNNEKVFYDSGCEKCLDLQTEIQEALKELSSTQL